MVIANEYTSDFFVGPLLFLYPILSGSRSSRGVQRTVQLPLADTVIDVVFAAVTELKSPATLVSPTSVRSPRISVVMRIFPYEKLSIIV